jgi:DNA-binding transcriptional MerR regulator
MALKPGKLYYSISEVSNHLDVAPSLLRYWESEFPSIKPKRNGRGTRFYTLKDIEAIERIYFLVKEQGFTLQGAKDKIKTDKKGVNANIEAVHKLQSVRDFLVKLKDSL